MKGKIGLLKCRLASPQALMECTKPTQLTLTINKLTDSTKLVPLKVVEPRRWNYNLGNFDSPLNYTDQRVIAWELERNTCDFLKYENFVFKDQNISNLLKFDLKNNINGRIISYSPTLSNLLSCNTALYLLGSGEQAKAICYYMFDYLLKDTVQKVNTLSAGLSAYNKMKVREKEIEGGTKETQDIKKYFFNVFLNQVNNSMEFSATMASSLLLGLSSVKVSHEFWIVYITSATNLVMSNYVKKIEEEEKKKIASIESKKSSEKKISDLDNNYSTLLTIDTSDVIKVDKLTKKRGRVFLMSSLRNLNNKSSIEDYDNNKMDIVNDINTSSNVHDQETTPSQKGKSTYTKDKIVSTTTPIISTTFLSPVIAKISSSVSKINSNINYFGYKSKNLKTPKATTKKNRVDIDDNDINEEIIDLNDDNLSVIEEFLGEDNKSNSSCNSETSEDSVIISSSIEDVIRDNINDDEDKTTKPIDVESDSVVEEEDEFEEFFEGVLDDVVHVKAGDSKLNNNTNSSSINFTTGKDGKLNVTLSNQASNYSYRGKHLSSICLYLYVGIIVIIPIGDHVYIDPDKDNNGDSNVESKDVESEIEKIVNEVDGDSSDDDSISNDGMISDEDQISDDEMNNSVDVFFNADKDDNHSLDESIFHGSIDSLELELDESLQKKKKSGRHKNKIYFFSNDCPYKDSFVQVIRSKFYIPLIPCHKPKYPNFTEKPINSELSDAEYFSEKLAIGNKYGIFMLTLFKPWNISSKCPDGELSWFGFCEFVAFLCKRYDLNNVEDFSLLFNPAKFSNDSKFEDDSEEAQIEMKDIILNSNKKRIPLNRVIYQWIENMTTGLNPKKRSKKMLMMWRNRAVKTWHELKISNLAEANERKKLVNKLEFVYDKNDNEELEEELEESDYYNLYSKMVNQILNSKPISYTNDKDIRDIIEKGKILDKKNHDYLKSTMDLLSNLFNISNINPTANVNTNLENILPSSVDNNNNITIGENFKVFSVLSANKSNNEGKIMLPSDADDIFCLDSIIKAYKVKSLCKVQEKLSYNDMIELEIKNGNYNDIEKSDIKKWYDLLEIIESNGDISDSKLLLMNRPICLGSLNKTQQLVFELFCQNWSEKLSTDNKQVKKSYFNLRKQKQQIQKQLLTFIHGGPGTGKTFLILRCLEKLDILNYIKFRDNQELQNKSDASKVYATTGIASSNYIIYNGSTINGGLYIPTPKQKRKKKNYQADDVGN